MNKNIIITVLAVATLVFGFLYFTNSVFLGAGTGPTHWQKESFLQGLEVGVRDQFSVSNVGALTSSGANVLSGALTQSGVATFSGTLSASGVVTVTGNTQFSSSLATTTVIVAKGSATAGYSPGCLVIGDTTTSSTLNYVTVTNGVMTTTTTQPAICRK